MDAADWIDDDLGYVDNLESIQVTLAGTATTYDVDSALRRMVSIREAASSGGTYTVEDIKFHVPSRLLEKTPGVGSIVLADDGEEIWTVAAVMRAAHRTRWVAVCKRTLLNSELDETFTVQQPTYGRDDDMAQVATWTDYAANVLGKFWQQNRVVVDLESRRNENINANVFLKGVSGITSDMRIVRSNGDVFGINVVTQNELAMLTRVTVQDFSFPLVN